MWIKWQNLATPARSLTARLPACLPCLAHGHGHSLGLGLVRARARAHAHANALARPMEAAACARVALLCPFLSFSIKMDNFQPNKLSKHLVKIPYGIKPYNA